MVVHLLPGNFCATIQGDDPPGLQRGNGRLVYAKFQPALKQGDECRWAHVNAINQMDALNSEYIHLWFNVFLSVGTCSAAGKVCCEGSEDFSIACVVAQCASWAMCFKLLLGSERLLLPAPAVWIACHVLCKVLAALCVP